MAKYTYAQFESKAKDAGVLDKFGQADLDYIRDNPDLGVGLIGYKSQYMNAKNQDEKNAAAQGAQNLRTALGGYSVDPTGQYAIPETTGDFYDNKINALISSMQEKRFEYDPKNDPQYQAFRKQYLREGQRAMQGTMAEASAMTGGRPSSWAVSAANQANNYYAGQAADKIPELYQQAYNRYLDEFTRQGQVANLMQQQRSAQLERAEKAYQYGDTSRLIHLGIDPTADPAARQRELEKAQIAYQYGDPTLLNRLGINTDYDLNRRYQQMQIDDANWTRNVQRAQLAAQYGDYSELEGLGFDTSRANFQNQLAAAQLIAQYTGDVSYLRSLMR